MLPVATSEKIKNIRDDNISGAVELTKQAAHILLSVIDQVDEPSASRLTQTIEVTVIALVQAQPTMAPLFNLGNRVLRTIEPLRQKESIRQTLQQSCQDFLAQIEHSGHIIAARAAELIEDGMTIMTHSASATVLRAFLTARQTGKQFEVICTESRPMREGVKLAESLSRAGIPVKLIVDAATFSQLAEVQLIFVGADSVSPAGLVNKSGTLGLALAAAMQNVDLYALCGSEKFLPQDYSLPPEPLKNPHEILAEPVENVTVLNYYFDQTPLNYLHGLISENGFLKAPALRQALADFEIHPLLR